MDSKYKLKQWKNELNRLNESTGLTFDDICEYLGVSYSRDIGFYSKLPMKRRTYIGIGMAYGLPLEKINEWITTYGMKRRLYSKDISEDLVWIYLINRSYQSKVGFNYYKEYDKCQELAFETYLAFWNAIVSDNPDTRNVDKKLREIDYGEVFGDLKKFISDNIDAFKTAYAKPRRMLHSYVNCILSVKEAGRHSSARSLSSLRGWLDDSMINYLAGSSETVNVIDRASGTRTHTIKQIPKNRKTHISLALALGMTADEINDYLALMGFHPLDKDDPEERFFIEQLNKWEEVHPLQRMLKEQRIEGDTNIELDAEDERQAVSDMLMLRQELSDMYKRRGKKFPFLKD